MAIAASSPHLHPDVHIVRFKPTIADNKHFLYAGSDGGLAQIDLDAARKLMVAVGGFGADVYGVFAEENLAATYHWERLGSLLAIERDRSWLYLSTFGRSVWRAKLHRVYWR